MHRLALFIVACAIVMPSTATADVAPQTPAGLNAPLASTVPAIAPFVAWVDAAVWTNSPCAGRERVVLISDLTSPQGVRVAGLSYVDGSCVFAIDSTTALTDQIVTCEIVAHELGHLSGLGHSDDPTNIMAPVIPSWQPCDDFVATLAPAPSAPTIGTKPTTTISSKPHGARSIVIHLAKHTKPKHQRKKRSHARR